MLRLFSLSSLILALAGVLIFVSVIALQSPFSEEIFIAGKALIIVGTFFVFLDR